MQKPLFSVLMPVYNGEKYLREAIDSILEQTLTDFEFLIIDDGSKDNSVQIINSYNDPRIRLVKNETNLGISKTLNRGIEMASAEFIARMDADDISYPARLQKQYDYLIKHPRVLTVLDYPSLVESGLFFARKFDIYEDESVLDMLDGHLNERKNLRSLLAE